MSIPDEALQKLLQEIEQKAAVSNQQISIVKAQIAGKNRESRMLQLTSSELSSLPADTNVYEGIGKMFLFTPKTELKDKLDKQNAEAKEQTATLEKKLNYLETTAKNSKEHIDKLLNAGVKA